jgi:hypothetical protein
MCPIRIVTILTSPQRAACLSPSSHPQFWRLLLPSVPNIVIDNNFLNNVVCRCDNVKERSKIQLRVFFASFWCLCVRDKENRGYAKLSSRYIFTRCFGCFHGWCNTNFWAILKYYVTIYILEILCRCHKFMDQQISCYLDRSNILGNFMVCAPQTLPKYV